MNTDNRTDRTDIASTLRGDGDAFARLVRRYQDEIARYLWRFTRQQAVCEELVQDTFVEAFVSLRGFRGDAPLLHWLKRIATRVGYRYWKQKGRSVQSLGAEQVDGLVAKADASLEPRQAAEQLHRVLEQLPPRDRLVLTLMYLEEHSVAETAAMVGWTQTMVKVQAHRARGKLKRLLADSEVMS